MRGAGLLALAILLVSPSSFADGTKGTSEPVRLVYQVAAGCPDESTFSAIVMTRTQRAKFVGHDSASRRFVVEVRRHGKLYYGRLTIEASAATEGAPHGATRELTGARCADLVRAFALFTAIAIDPGSDGEPRDALEPGSSRERALPPTLRAPPSDARPADAPVEPNAERHEPLRPKGTERQASVPSGTPPEPARVWHGAWGSGVFVAGGIAQSLMASAHPVFEVASSGPLFSPSVQIGFVWANAASERAGTAELAIGLRMIVLSGCAVRIPVAGAIVLRLCAALEGGVSTVQPFGIVRPKTLVTPWVAVDPLVRFDVPVLPPVLTLAMHAGAGIPFQRLHGYVAPGPVVSEIGAVGVRLGADVLLQAF